MLQYAYAFIHRGTFALTIVAAACTALCMSDAHARLLDDSGYVAPEAVEICRIMANAHRFNLPTYHTNYGALQMLHAFAEQTMRRPYGSERLGDAAKSQYQILLAPLTLKQRRQLAALFASLGDVNSVPPENFSYDYIFIHGSSVPAMRRRLAALATSLQQQAFALGPNAEVIFFDGERPLFATETLEVLLDPSPYLRDPTFTPPAKVPKDERQAAEMVYRQMWLPTALRRLPVTFVHAPADPGHARAHTEGVVRYWLETAHPHAGRALMVSDNPFVEYQRLATVLALRQEHGQAIDVLAMGAEDAFEDHISDATLGVQLDNLAASLALALRLQESSETGIQATLKF